MTTSDNRPPFVLEEFASIRIIRRDRLLSIMLQDRGALRLISAPHGFGKSLLAYEYAQRMSSVGEVLWLDASRPEFLGNLDDGFLIPPSRGFDGTYGLLVMDDLPYLDEVRLQNLSSLIDALLYQGTEVVVTSLPSNDCLGSVQPDRILIGARDLLIDEDEVKAPILADPSRENAEEEAENRWRTCRESAFGRVAAVVWGKPEESLRKCLKGFFSEKLPPDIHKAAFMMALLSEGSIEQLRALGVPFSEESERMFVCDYPVFGIDSIKHEYFIPGVSLADLCVAIAQSEWVGAMTGGDYPLPERALGVLLRRGAFERISEITEALCTDERCGKWLSSSGWFLLNRGEENLVNTLFDRCFNHCLNSPDLLVLEAWCKGLSRDDQEAKHFAEAALRTAMEKPGEESAFAELMAYLAFELFGEGHPLIYGKNTYCQDEIDSPEKFLMAVVDNCTEVEISRALCFCHPSRLAGLE